MLRILSHPAVLLFFTVVTFVLCTSLYINSRKMGQTDKVIAGLQADLQKNSQDVANAQAQLDAAKDPFTKEKMIRDQLLMQKPGEYVVQIPDVSPVPMPAVESQKPLTPWEKWRALFLN